MSSSRAGWPKLSSRTSAPDAMAQELYSAKYSAPSRGEVGLPVLSSEGVADEGVGPRSQLCKGVERGNHSKPEGCR